MANDHTHRFWTTGEMPVCDCGKTLLDLYNETVQELTQAQQENTTMRAILEELNHCDFTDDAEVARVDAKAHAFLKSLEATDAE